jgi:hypothetical protein
MNYIQGVHRDLLPETQIIFRKGVTLCRAACEVAS